MTTTILIGYALWALHIFGCCELVQKCEVDVFDGSQLCYQYLECDCNKKGNRP